MSVYSDPASAPSSGAGEGVLGGRTALLSSLALSRLLGWAEVDWRRGEPLRLPVELEMMEGEGVRNCVASTSTASDCEACSSAFGSGVVGGGTPERVSVDLRLKRPKTMVVCW